MARQGPERRLTTILVADVVGFSRLTELDEEGTLARLRQLRTALIDPSLAEHRGRMVKTTGDGLLIEFSSVVDALRCAIAIQRGMLAHNAALAPERRMEFRIGVNLGDVVVEGEDLLGDGVNIAARLESLSEPSGICIAESVWRFVEGKGEATFEDMGERLLKNIARPIRVFKVAAASLAANTEGAVASLVHANTALLGTRPSIAVLAFTNVSGDAEQEYFSDGIAEDITTALARLRWFNVISRNSSFAYKGRAHDVREIGRELGARYVLEGSVRKSGCVVRINAQLVEASTGGHLWAERYDRSLTDIFAVQDQITTCIGNAIAPELLKAEGDRAEHREPASVDAWDAIIRGYWHFHRINKEDNGRARDYFERALTLDPRYSHAWSLLAQTHSWDLLCQWTDDIARSLAELKRTAEQALRLDDEDTVAQVALGCFAILVGQFGRARELAQEAIRLNPGAPHTYWSLAWALTTSGSHADALVAIRRALELGPKEPLRFNFYTVVACAEYFLGHYPQGLAAAVRSLELNPNAVFPPALRIACLAELGRLEEAREALQAHLRARPGRPFAPIRYLANREDRERFFASLLKAGYSPS
ncbi:adenylate/guanylate cyclase domain-containing protein [Bradyrhizobium sp. SZCCHNR1020]|uniref:adenylate/guanylate cyclase domain-containing protein n=1 Tax=Bradyrhizobium sp. SZCCHNR1020 TaxID=3057343 RepID=UPI002917062B|nr:adenylate/guanylate cyclase domain-containing protein [Bradyrhizobium sp. SZCCHNR1020]